MKKMGPGNEMDPRRKKGSQGMKWTQEEMKKVPGI